jgi:hypothetical protein
MAGKKGIKRKHEDDKRFAEYYKKQHPEWTLEECENAARYFKRSCNYQCIEYYERNYPELSHEEHLKLKTQLQEQKKSNNPFNIEYYEKNFPDLTKDEQLEKLHAYARSKNYQCEEYYLTTGISEDEAEKLKNQKIKIAANKISKKVSGELNGMHRSKTTQQKRNSISPRNIAFYERKYPNLSHEEHLKLQKEFFEKNKLAVKSAVKKTNIEYYLNQGMSEEDAKKALHNRQATFTYEKCVEKYGEIEGNRIFCERQRKWVKSLQNNFSKNGDGRSPQSKFAKTIIKKCCKYLHIPIPKKEKYIYWKQTSQAFAYDFTYKNKIIEFQGDYWHCNPILYDENFYNKVKQQTAKEIWNFDELKKQCANFYGYDVLYIWEYEYNNNPKATVKKCIDFLTT